MDEFNPILQEFRDLLSTLNNTKATINHVTAFCLSQPDHWDTFMEFIEGGMEEAHSLDDRITLLYLVDSICQTAARHQVTLYAEGLARHDALLRLFVAAFDAAEKTRKENETFSRMEKILNIWRGKQIFSGETLDAILALLGRRLPVRAGNQELLKWIDEDRRHRKTARIDKCFRPDGFTSDDEFDAMWAAAAPCKVLCRGRHVCVAKDPAELARPPSPSPVKDKEKAKEKEKQTQAARRPARSSEKEKEKGAQARKRGASPVVEEEREDGEIPAKKPKSGVQRCRIWDLDETLIILNTLFKSTSTDSRAPRFAEAHLFKATSGSRRLTREEDKALRAELKRGHKLGAAVEDAVYHIEDTFMFGQQIMLLNAKLESVRDLAPLDDHVDLSAYDFKNDGWNPKDQRDADQAWYRKLAYRMRFIEETYNKLRGDPKAKDVLYAGMGDKRARSETAGREVDHYTNGWISVADTVLRKARDQPDSADVIVTTSEVTGALAKLLVYGLARYFPAENVYHAPASGKDVKLKTMRNVVSRFGEGCAYTVIGDGDYELEAGKKLGMDVRHIRELTDLKKLMGPLSNNAI